MLHNFYFILLINIVEDGKQPEMLLVFYCEEFRALLQDAGRILTVSLLNFTPLGCSFFSVDGYNCDKTMGLFCRNKGFGTKEYLVLRVR